MKFNWGHGLATALGIAMILLLTLVYNVTQEKVDLVTEDYYPKELKYDEDMAKLANYKALQKEISIETDTDIHLLFPKELVTAPDSISGTIHIYRPSDKNMDIHIPISLSEGYRQSFPLSALKNGRYDIIIDWEAKGKKYLIKKAFTK